MVSPESQRTAGGERSTGSGNLEATASPVGSASPSPSHRLVPAVIGIFFPCFVKFNAQPLFCFFFFPL